MSTSGRQVKGKGRSSAPSLLSLSREARVRALQAALVIDGVLSEAQVRRMFGLEVMAFTERELRALDLYVFPVEGVQVFKGPVEVYNFIAPRPLDLLQTSSQIIHQVGTAEMRYALGSPTDWSAGADALAAMERPDALYRTPGGVHAIEYDTGSYSSKRVADKLVHFSGFPVIHWGCSSPVRVRRLRQRYSTVEKLRVTHVAWWV